MTEHERPGVYSSYDASTVVSGNGTGANVGIAAICSKGEAGKLYSFARYEEAVTAFGEEEGLTGLVKLLFLNGAAQVKAVPVAEEGGYEAAFAVLEAAEDIGVVVCDSETLSVQQALRQSVCDASEARRERIAVVGGDDEDVEDLIAHASALNSERMVLVGPDVLDTAGESLSGVYAAAALAGLLASSADPAVPINGAALQGLGGVAVQYSDSFFSDLGF